MPLSVTVTVTSVLMLAHVHVTHRQALEAGLLQKSVKRKADDLGVVATAEVVVAPKLKGGRFDTLGDVSSDSSEEDA